MEVMVTVADAAGRAVDVALECGPATTVAALRAALAAEGLGPPAGSALYADGRPVPPDAEVASVLVEGCVLGGRPTTPRRVPGAPEVRVVAGPRCGTVHPLPDGATTVGRGRTASLRLDDDLVSREHLSLEVRGHEVAVTDLGSTNGSLLADRSVGPSTPWTTGARLHLGASTLVLETAPVAGVDTPQSGRVPVATPPRLRAPVPRLEVRFPDLPPAPRSPRLPLAAAVAPLLVGVVVALVLGSTTFLLFALLSPVVVLAAAASDRGHARREHREAVRRHRRELAAAQETLQGALAEEVERRHEDDPDCAALLLTAATRGPRLWERRLGDEDVLRVRVGTADLPARTGVVGGTAATSPAAPLTVDLPGCGALGVVARRDDSLAVARAVVGSAAVLHGPAVLRVVVLAPGRADDWAWVRWLPHARDPGGRVLLGLDAAGVDAVLDELAGSPGATEDGDASRVLVVVDGPGLRDHATLAALLAPAAGRGVSALCLATHARDLPAACRAVLADEGADAGWVLRHDGAAHVPGVRPDGVPQAWAERVARHLAPVVLAGPASPAGLPGRVAWTELAGVRLAGDATDRAVVLERWAAPAGPVAPLGAVSGGGVLTVDLRRDGPHCLVAGTTGAGKSELLQTLVAGLALANPPDALQLVLVDYKGGAAFGACAGLPHTAGLVTDLDPALTRRALASLSAELRRREAVLLDAGVPDLEAYDALRRREAPGRAARPLPRLVLVVDEFATLAEELPEFVRGLVAVAQRGRSLGVHLVLATQRPEGSVSQDIRANTALRICLAVAREADSRDVLDAPDAARISRTSPGRGYLRHGAEGLVAFQAGRVTVTAEPGPGQDLPQSDGSPHVRPLTLADLTVRTGTTGTPPGRPDGPTDLERLVAACVAAAGTRPVPAPPSPWLPPLPDTVPLDDLLAPADVDTDGPGRVPFALQDRPETQSREVLALDLRGNLVVAGAPRSGRTTTLLTLASAAALRFPPTRLHLVGVDCGGGALRGLERLPHCGAVVTGDEPGRLARLVAALTREVGRRRSTDERDDPHLLLLLDQWDALAATTAELDAGRALDDLLRVLRDGPAVGITAVVTADRTALVGRVAGLLPQRLLLRLPDPGDFAVVGVSARDVPPGLPPGRGIDGAGLLTQVALPGGIPDASPRDLLAGVVARAGALPPGAPGPLRVDPLPPRVTLGATEALRRERPGSARTVTVGVGGDRLGPLDVDLDDTGPVFLVAGPPRSGRSTTLLTLLTSLLPRLAVPPRVVVVTPRTSPLRAASGLAAPVTVVPQTAEAGSVAALLDRPAVLVLDDAELLADGPLAAVLDGVVAGARDTGTVVLAAGTTAALLGAYRGWVPDARRTRTGLLLAPESPGDGELLGCRLPRGAGWEALPGRGLLVVRGAPAPVQVALPGPVAQPVPEQGSSPRTVDRRTAA